AAARVMYFCGASRTASCGILVGCGWPKVLAGMCAIREKKVGIFAAGLPAKLIVNFTCISILAIALGWVMQWPFPSMRYDKRSSAVRSKAFHLVCAKGKAAWRY